MRHDEVTPLSAAYKALRGLQDEKGAPVKREDCEYRLKSTDGLWLDGVRALDDVFDRLKRYGLIGETGDGHIIVKEWDEVKPVRIGELPPIEALHRLGELLQTVTNEDMGRIYCILRDLERVYERLVHEEADGR